MRLRRLQDGKVLHFSSTEVGVHLLAQVVPLGWLAGSFWEPTRSHWDATTVPQMVDATTVPQGVDATTVPKGLMQRLPPGGLTQLTNTSAGTL